MDKNIIVIGLGSGRTGTASLAHMIDSQKGGLCFHELNPTGVVFDGNPQPILNTTNEFQRILDGGPRNLLSIDYARPASLNTYNKLQSLDQINILGDIAYYYLKYVDDILASNSLVKFVCIKRDKTDTVNSWLVKSSIRRWRSLKLADRIKSLLTRTPYYESYNFWQEHDGSKWKKNPVWDKTFPNFSAGSKKEAIEMYWDYYYKEAEKLETRHPDNFRIFDISAMSTREGQKEILSFIGLSEDEMVIEDEFHMHKSANHYKV
jgi:hypothetical protein